MADSIRGILDGFEHFPYSQISTNMTEWLHLANVRRNSPLPSTFLQTLDETTKFSIQKLIPSVCRGDLDCLQAALGQSGGSRDALAKTAEIVPASVNNLATSIIQKTSVSAECAPVTSPESTSGRCTNASGKRQTADSNFMCPFSGLSLLHYAVLANQQEVIRLLLENGADPNRVAENSLQPESEPWSSTITPLHMAAYLRNLDSVSALIESGARVTKDLWKNFHKPNSHGCGDKILEFLFHNGRNFLPVDDAIAIIANCETPIPQVLRARICRWSPDFDRSNVPVLNLLKCSEALDVLRTQTYTAEENLVKASVMQYLLLSVCYLGSPPTFPDLNSRIFIPAWLSLLDVLITEGASPVGWSVRQLEIMTTAWEQVVASLDSGHIDNSIRRSPILEFRDYIKVRRNFSRAVPSIGCCANDCRNLHSLVLPGMYARWDLLSPPCLLPAVVRLATRALCDDDPVAERLVQLANQCAPCVVQTPGQVRYAYGYPHISPRCSHVSLSEEQKSTSLIMCSYTFSHVSSLSARCRDVILRIIPEGNFLQSVHDLPLPEKIKSYVISG